MHKKPMDADAQLAAGELSWQDGNAGRIVREKNSGEFPGVLFGRGKFSRGGIVGGKLSRETLRKIHRYFLRQKSRPKNPDFSDMSITGILAGITPSKSVKVRHSPLASENWAITWKRRKIGGKLVLITNRKSYMSFRLVQQLRSAAIPTAIDVAGCSLQVSTHKVTRRCYRRPSAVRQTR